MVRRSGHRRRRLDAVALSLGSPAPLGSPRAAPPLPTRCHFRQPARLGCRPAGFVAGGAGRGQPTTPDLDRMTPVPGTLSSARLPPHFPGILATSYTYTKISKTNNYEPAASEKYISANVAFLSVALRNVESWTYQLFYI